MVIGDACFKGGSYYQEELFICMLGGIGCVGIGGSVNSE